MDDLIVTAWSNGGRAPADYGLRLNSKDRDAYFRREMRTDFVALPDGGEAPEIGVDSRSFWNACHQLRSAGIGKWLLRRGAAPWPDRKPPKFKLIREGDRRFRVADI